MLLQVDSKCAYIISKVHLERRGQKNTRTSLAEFLSFLGGYSVSTGWRNMSQLSPLPQKAIILVE